MAVMHVAVFVCILSLDDVHEVRLVACCASDSANLEYCIDRRVIGVHVFLEWSDAPTTPLRLGLSDDWQRDAKFLQRERDVLHGSYAPFTAVGFR